MGKTLAWVRTLARCSSVGMKGPLPKWPLVAPRASSSRTLGCGPPRAGCGASDMPPYVCASASRVESCARPADPALFELELMRPSHRIKRLSTFWGQYLPLGPPPRRRHMDMDRDFRDARAAQIRADRKSTRLNSSH